MKTTADKVRELLTKGKRPGDISNRLNISQSYVYNIKKQMQAEATSDLVDKMVEEKVWDEIKEGNTEVVIENLGLFSDPQYQDMINSPHHYTAGGVETIDFIEAKGLGYHLGNVVKYVSRSSFKDNRIEDLEKAKWYLDRAIEQLAKDDLNNV
jgi:hypothetical protein